MENPASNSEPKNTQPPPSLFPLSATASAATTTATSWLSNASFTANISAINSAVSYLHESDDSDDEDDEIPAEDSRTTAEPKRSSYELLESSESDERESRERKKRRRKKEKKRSRDERGKGLEFGSRKSRVRAWADSADTNTATKDYYFDAHGDFDNLTYGSLYRMDVARYKAHDAVEMSRYECQGLGWYRQGKGGSLMEEESDINALDSKLKSGGRYWSAKYAALEKHKNLKRSRIIERPKKSEVTDVDDFIGLKDGQTTSEGIDDASVSVIFVEESWEDEVLRKTREFNKMTREHPHDEKIWLSFAEFQDKVASMQPHKGARLQILEKKISILETATELNPENEELLLCLLKAYKSRDTTDVLIGKWEKILVQHSGSFKLWAEFLHVVQGDFSMFKVSDIRKMYVHAIQALYFARSKRIRQVDQNSVSDSDSVQLELGLVDVFMSLCRFEWQAGFHELATGLFQAQIEYNLFCPSLHLTEQSKQRLFEFFWDSDGARVGEDGAHGWATWLEKEEENRQKVIKEDVSKDDKQGGWTGWSEPFSKHKGNETIPDEMDNNDIAMEESQSQSDNEDTKDEEDTETMLKMLGIDADAVAGAEVKDTSTWIKWSEEESSRDCNQWMPVRAKSGNSILHADDTPVYEEDEQALRVILYEDVSEYLFSLSSREACLSLIFQFIEFYGGKIFPWVCTNSSCWTERLRNVDALPDFMLQYFRSIHSVLNKLGTSATGFGLDSLLGSSYDASTQSNMMKFLRNATLLSLSAFPRNHILEEAILIAEELFVTKMKTRNASVTPCRPLAKNLLKTDRQDILLCGVYARREAAFGNIDHARRVFDMALSAVESLPTDQLANAPIIYFWYAESELGYNYSNPEPECTWRAMHILSCLGSDSKYSPFKCQPSSLQLLKARQGFKEKMRTVRLSWTRGAINDQSLALVCSAALFEELTAGWAASIDVLDQAFSMVLPGSRRNSYQLEFLSSYYVKMLQRHHKESGFLRIWEAIMHGLQIYPFNPELFHSLLEVGHLYTTNKLRWVFDDFCRKKPSITAWLYSLAFEMSRGSPHRIRGLFERALADDNLRNSVVLWRYYVAYETHIAGDPYTARRIFFRAIHACPWSKKLWLDGFVKLNSILTPKELSDLQEVMRDKELNLRTDIYEILLQDDQV